MPTKEDYSPNGCQIVLSIYKKKLKLKQTHVFCMDIKKKVIKKKKTHVIIAKYSITLITPLGFLWLKENSVPNRLYEWITAIRSIVLLNALEF